jgi:hypothetical protein
MAACFSTDAVMQKHGWECYGKPEKRLGQQPKAKRFGKTIQDYQARHINFREAWFDVVAQLSEAQSFHTDFLKQLIS